MGDRIPPLNEKLTSEHKISLLQCSNRTDVRIDECTYSWTVTNFIVLNCSKKDRFLQSPEFYMGNNTDLKWQIRIYPEGLDEKRKELVALFLSPVEAFQENLDTWFSFSVLNEKKKELLKSETNYTFLKGSLLGYGFPEFCKRNHLLNSMLSKGKLRISCKIRTISSIKEEASPINLKNIFNSEKFSDFTIITQNNQFKVHKIFLATASPVFDSMLTVNMIENAENSVTILDIPSILIQEMLRFIYTAKVNNIKSIAAKLLPIAEKYQIEELKKLCEQELDKSLNDNNAWDLLILGDRYHGELLKKKALQYITKRKIKITNIEDFKQLTINNPELIVEIFNFQVIIICWAFCSFTCHIIYTLIFFSFFV